MRKVFLLTSSKRPRRYDLEEHAVEQKRAISKGQQVLHDMLRERGIDPAAPKSFRPVWEVFKEFIAIPFDTPDDGVLYEIGIYNFYGPDEFYLGFLRQFAVTDEEGEDDYLEQLHCEFRFPVNRETRSFGEFNRWWFASEGTHSWLAFVAGIERRPEFIALRDAKPQAVFMEQEEV